jgi:hypothetical protein
MNPNGTDKLRGDEIRNRDKPEKNATGADKKV